MKNSFMTRIGAAIFICALTMPITLVAQDHDDHHDDHRFYDKRHRDYHNWDGHEDRAYHMYWEHRHRPYVAFETLTPAQRQAYWDWRHNHSDAILKIDIR
jgi:hypothetical protein